MDKSRTDYSILNIATGLGGYAVNTILGLICRMVFTRTLEAEYLGINGLFTNILGMLSLAELGIGSAIVYALYKPLAVNDEKKIASLVKFYGQCYRAVGIFIGAAGLCLLPFLDLLIGPENMTIPHLRIFYLLYLFNTASSYFFSYRSSLLMAAQRNYLVTGLSYLVTIAQSVIQMGLLFATGSYMAYLLVQTAGTLVYNVTISHLAKRQFPFIADRDIPPLDREERRGLLANVRALIVWKLAGLLVNQTDSIIITYFSGLSAVGLVSNYTLLSSTLNSLLNQLFNGITASIGNHNALESTADRLRLFRTVNLANFWLFGWAAIGICLVSSDLVALLFGESYVLHWSIPFILAVNFYTVGMQSAVWTYNNTMGLFRQGRYLLLLTAAINLAASIWLGNIWGLFGIYFATTLSRLCTNLWYDPYKLFKHGFHMSARPYAKRYFSDLLVLCAAGGLCLLLCQLVELPLGIRVIYRSVVCSLVPNAVFLLCFHRSEEFRYLREIAERVVKKLLRRSGRQSS